jgi:hypothetical protein
VTVFAAYSWLQIRPGPAPGELTPEWEPMNEKVSGIHDATSVMWHAEYDDLCRVKKPIDETRQFKT